MSARIVVTGGASGMGEAIVRAFIADGAPVASLDLDEAAGRKIVEEAGRGSAASPAIFIHCDVSAEQSVAQAFAQAAEHIGGIDCLFHAAAIAPGTPADSLTADAWDRVMGINARGTFLTNQQAFHRMKDRGGRIINFASAAGITGLPGKAHYSASKGAVLAWTRTAAKEWGRYGITVNAVAPAIRTPMYEKTRSLMSDEQRAALDSQLAANMPIDGRLGDPERDLVPFMRFLASDGARFMTGQTFSVDGGLLTMR